MQATKKMLEGRKVESPPQALIMYELCSKFKKLPDEIDRQGYKEMQELLIVHNTISEYEAKQSKRDKRKEAVKKFGNGGGR